MTDTVFYADLIAVANELLTEFGMPAVLRSIVPGTRPDRPCVAAIVDYRPRDQETHLANPTDRQVLIDPIDPATGLPMTLPPDNEQDQLVPTIGPDANKLLPFTSPVKLYAPAGIVVLYETTVRR